MNPEPTPTPREQTEMRLTALLMGELSAEETVALHAQIAADPGLARLHARLRQAMELLREATAEPEPATPTPAQLSSERRERLLAHFKSPAPQPAKPAPIVKAPRRNWSWVVPLGAAAAVVVILAGLLFPAIAPVKMSARPSPPGFSFGGANAPSEERQESISRAFDSDAAEMKERIAKAGGEAGLEGGKSSPFLNYLVRIEPTPATGATALGGAGKSNASALYLPPTTDAPVAGERDAVAKTSEPALPVLGDVPVLGSLFSNRQGTSPALDLAKNLGSEGEKATGLRQGQAVHDDQVQAQIHRAASDCGTTRKFEKGQLSQSRAMPVVEPALPAADFDGSVTFGSAIAKAPAAPSDSGIRSGNSAIVPTARPADAQQLQIVRESRYDNKMEVPQKPAVQHGKDAGRVAGAAGPPASSDKSREIAAKHVEIAQNNLKDLSDGIPRLFTDDETAKLNIDTRSEGTIRDEPSDPRRPATKADGEKVQQLARALDALEATDSREKKKEPAKPAEREVDPFGDADEVRAAQPAPEPAPLATQPPPPPKLERPVVEMTKELQPKEIAIQPREPEMLFKTIDEQKELPPEGRGENALSLDVKEALARARAEAAESSALVDTLTKRKKDLEDRLVSLEQYKKRREAGLMTIAPDPGQPKRVAEPEEKTAAEEVAIQPREPEMLYKQTDEMKELAPEGRDENGKNDGREAFRLELREKVKRGERVAQMQSEDVRTVDLLPRLSVERAATAAAEYASDQKMAWANPVRKYNAPQATPALAEEKSAAPAGNTKVEEEYVAAAAEAQKAEVLERSGEFKAALDAVRAAARSFEKVKKDAPGWQKEIVGYRVNRTEDARRRLETKLSKVGGPVSEKAVEPAAMLEELPAARPAQPAAIPQPEVATSANAFSTFSLNVSDVAFKLAGASLEKGQMPELATVRSEEFINAFDYRDPEPAAGAPLAFATERARYPFAQNRDLVRFSVKTAAAGRQPGRPLNLVLLLDNSGSMERADRVRILREALRVLAAQLQPQDRLSVVAFARTPRIWADGVTGDKAGAAVARVGEITPQGGTNLEAALDLGYATALKHYQPGSISRVVLLTDGAANLGDVNPDALKRKVETNRQRGVALDCFGIGWEGYDDTLLETLARNGDGRYGFINTPEEAASGFAAQLAGALRVAASDVKVQVEWNPRRVTAYRQIGYAKHQLKKEQFRDNTVDAAEIGAAESGNALYVVEVNPRGAGDLATVRVRFKVPGTSDYKEHEWAVPFTKDAPSLEQASPALRLAGTASAFSEWLVASPYAAEVTTDRLLGLLNGVPAIYPADPRPKKLEWMIRTAKSVSGR